MIAPPPLPHGPRTCSASKAPVNRSARGSYPVREIATQLDSPALQQLTPARSRLRLRRWCCGRDDGGSVRTGGGPGRRFRHSRLVTGMLFGVAPLDPMVYGGVITVLLAIAGIDSS